MAKQEFQTEVSQLLQLIIHSLYSHKEIFLREIISNSSDAIDKLNYLSITDEKMKKISFTPQINIEFNEKEKTLTIKDNGIGMNKEDLTNHLGTIARSGTKNFLSQLSGDAKKDSNLIGQFGVGFYSCFMVSDNVDVITKKAGEDQAYKWNSDGKSGFTITECEKDTHGTDIILYLNDEGKEYASQWEIQQIVKKYSNHLAFPIYLHYEKAKYDKDGKEEGSELISEQINSASALWKRSKSELKEEDYNEFYKSLSMHDQQDPLMHMHTQAEGTIEYTSLFYIPQKSPFDMYQADYQPGVKLYVKRVFITGDDKDLLPPFLRFVRGIIDSEDLPLNVSREILQQNRILSNIKNASVKKILSEFEKLAKNDNEKYLQFINEYNRPLKEGIYSEPQYKDRLLELIRFKSTTENGLISLSSYVERMKEEQKSIYFITGKNEDNLRNSPLLETYHKKGIEVLIADGEIDEIVMPSIEKYKDFEIKSVNRSDSADELKDDEDKKIEENSQDIIARLKVALGDKVKDVTVSARLQESPSCVVSDKDEPNFQMQAIMKSLGQEPPEIKPILEINPKHSIIQSLDTNKDEVFTKDIAQLLLDQALLAEGMPLKEPNSFIKILNKIIEKSL